MLVLERLLALLIVIVLATQVVVPVIAGKRVFWLFRKSSRSEAKLRKAKQDEEEAKRELETAEREARALELKQKAEAVERKAINSYIEDASKLQ